MCPPSLGAVFCVCIMWLYFELSQLVGEDTNVIVVRGRDCAEMSQGDIERRTGIVDSERVANWFVDCSSRCLRNSPSPLVTGNSRRIGLISKSI
jgi:uncharacterized protein YfaT (DUF1175 family)